MKFELGAFNSSVIVASHEITVVSLISAPSCVCVIIRILAQVSLLLNIHLFERQHEVQRWQSSDGSLCLMDAAAWAQFLGSARFYIP